MRACLGVGIACVVRSPAHSLCAGTEIAFCILSLTAKMYLGWFLLINVIYVDGSADETLRANNEVR